MLKLLDSFRGRWLGVEAIFRSVSQIGADEGININSIYRSLKAFEDAGLVQRTWYESHRRTRAVYRLPGDAADDSALMLVCRACDARFRFVDLALREALMQVVRQHEGAMNTPPTLEIACAAPDGCPRRGDRQ